MGLAMDTVEQSEKSQMKKKDLIKDQIFPDQRFQDLLVTGKNEANAIDLKEDNFNPYMIDGREVPDSMKPYMDKKGTFDYNKWQQDLHERQLADAKKHGVPSDNMAEEFEKSQTDRTTIDKGQKTADERYREFEKNLSDSGQKAPGEIRDQLREVTIEESEGRSRDVAKDTAEDRARERIGDAGSPAGDDNLEDQDRASRDGPDDEAKKLSRTETEQIPESKQSQLDDSIPKKSNEMEKEGIPEAEKPTKPETEQIPESEQTNLNDFCGPKRELYVGDTPSRFSDTGQKVIEKMRNEGKIRGDGGNLEFQDSKGTWHPIKDADMGHKEPAVVWWNREGYQYGPRSPEVRAWMTNSDNYYLEDKQINRSEGAFIGEYYKYRYPEKKGE